MTRDKKLRMVAQAIEDGLIKGGPALNPLMLANIAVQVWERLNSNEYLSDDDKKA